MDSVVTPYLSQIGHVFMHYQGGRYLVVQIAIDSETLEPLVVYESLKDSRIWVRPAKMFFSTVKVDGDDVPRFAKCSSLDVKSSK